VMFIHLATGASALGWTDPSTCLQSPLTCPSRCSLSSSSFPSCARGGEFLFLHLLPKAFRAINSSGATRPRRPCIKRVDLARAIGFSIQGK
jgi:hypothetical protein